MVVMGWCVSTINGRCKLPTISIIVSVHNRKDYLSHSMGSWFSKPCLPEEIIIIDDRSTDDIFGTINVFCEQHPEWRHLFRYVRVRGDGQEWRNPGVCHNWGVRACETDYYVILDPETMFVNDCLAATKFHLDHNNKSFVNAGIHYEVNWRYRDDFNIFDPYYIIRKAKTHYGFPPNTEGWEVCQLTNCHSHAYAAGRKEYYTAIGGKDERMTGWGWEDVDIRNRMYRNSYAHDTTDSIAIIHVGHGLMSTSPWGFPEDRPEAAMGMEKNKRLLEANDAAALRIANQHLAVWGQLPIEKEHRWT